MRATASLPFIVVLLSQAADADVVRRQAVPESLWGTWAPSAEICEQTDKSVFVLSAKTYVGSEMNCAVDWVSQTAGTRGSIYSVRLQCSGTAAGAARTPSNLVILPKAADQISAGSGFDSLKVYQRCPAKEPTPER
jgi:hypothetical protein